MSPEDTNPTADETEQASGLPIEEDTPSEDAEEGGADFIALYTSLMLLLLSFFIVLYSMASTSTNKFNSARRSINEEFTTLGLSNAKKALVFIYSYMKLKSSIPTESYNDDIDRVSQKGPIAGGTNEDQASPDIEDLAEMTGSLVMMGLNIVQHDDDLMISIPTKDLFNGATTELNAHGKRLLVNMLAIVDNKFDIITVHSFSEEEPPGGFTERNSFTFTTERAYTIAAFTAEQLDLPTKDVRFYGYGPHRPAYILPEDDDHRGLTNNRVDFWLSTVCTDMSTPADELVETSDEGAPREQPQTETPEPPTETPSPAPAE